jgi:hypothetical protein
VLAASKDSSAKGERRRRRRRRHPFRTLWVVEAAAAG